MHSIFIGVSRGLMQEILLLSSWLGTLIVSYLYKDQLVAVLAHITFFQQTTKLVIVFIVLFIIIRVIVLWFVQVINKFINMIYLSWVNYILGGVFGLGRGLITILLIISLNGVLLHYPQKLLWKKALFRPNIEAVVLFMKSYLPNHYAKYIYF